MRTLTPNITFTTDVCRLKRLSDITRPLVYPLSKRAWSLAMRLVSEATRLIRLSGAMMRLRANLAAEVMSSGAKVKYPSAPNRRKIDAAVGLPNLRERMVLLSINCTSIQMAMLVEI